VARGRACATGTRAIRRGISAFSTALNSGSRWWNWKTKPTWRLRNATSAASGDRRDVVADLHVARIGTIETAQQVQQRALAHARRAHDGDHLAAFHRDRQVAQHRQAAFGDRRRNFWSGPAAVTNVHGGYS
jgi:hypothetical protein